MKKLKLALVSTLLCLVSIAQKDIFSNNKIFIDQNSKVIYPAFVVKDLVLKGKYTITKIGNTDTIFIKELTNEEKEQKFAKIPIYESGIFKNGETISSFNALTIDNKKIKVNTKLGKILVLNFWFIDCSPCRMEIPELNSIQQEFKDSNIIFLAIALDDKNDIENFIKNTPFNYQIVDGGRYITSQLGIKNYPINVVVDATGKIIFNSMGYSPVIGLNIRKSIQKALSQKQE